MKFPTLSKSPRVKNAMLIGAGLLVLIATWTTQPSVDQKSVPIPFPTTNESALKGAIVSDGQRNGYEVYNVTFNRGEVSETLGVDKIYLVYVPEETGISTGQMDLMLTGVTTGTRNVDYFGYKYSDIEASEEIVNQAAAIFKNRFPGEFFASQKAWQLDPQHNNSLALFEAQKNIRFLSTSNTPGGVRVSASGGLFLLIINEPGGAILRLRGVTGCGNGIPEAGEACDDGDSDDTNSCTNMCTIRSGSSTGATLAVDMLAMPAFLTAGSSSTITLLTFDMAVRKDDVRVEKMVFSANTGSLSSAGSYRIWADANADGIFERPIGNAASPAGGRLSFTMPSNWTGALIASGGSMAYALKATTPGVISEEKLQIKFESSLADYITATQDSTVSLRGINTNGICNLPNGCQISVTTRPATVWTFTECGDGGKDPGEECDDGNQANDDDCDNMCRLTIPVPDFSVD